MTKDLIALITDLTREILDMEGDLSVDLGPDTRLFGRDGLLDSMGIVSLIVAVEQAIEDRHGALVSLADERALSQSSGPYRTISTLADYASALLEGAQ